jgi:5'-3' exonuclease
MMENLEIIDLIVTNDSDLIALGAETVLCADRNVVFSKPHMRKQMGFTNECWKDFMYLCKKVEPLIAYSMIRVYKEYAVERWETLTA